MNTMLQFNRVFRSASLNMTQRELNKYKPAKTGIRVAVHKHQNNEAVISLFGSRQMAFKQDEVTMNDINEELSRMSSKIISERLSEIILLLILDSSSLMSFMVTSSCLNAICLEPNSDITASLF